MLAVERTSFRPGACEGILRRLLQPHLTLCTILLLGGSGCAGVSLLTAGTLIGSAGEAATTGTEVYNLGKLDFSAMATFDECRSAAADAITDLELHIKATEFVGKRNDEILFKVEDDHKTKIDVRIDRRAGKLCECRVDVGIFGSEPTAKLIVERFRRHLPRLEGTSAVETSPRKSGNSP
jgi:hypothetical protein